MHLSSSITFDYNDGSEQYYRKNQAPPPIPQNNLPADKPIQNQNVNNFSIGQQPQGPQGAQMNPPSQMPFPNQPPPSTYLYQNLLLFP